MWFTSKIKNIWGCKVSLNDSSEESHSNDHRYDHDNDQGLLLPPILSAQNSKSISVDLSSASSSSSSSSVSSASSDHFNQHSSNDLIAVGVENKEDQMAEDVLSEEEADLQNTNKYRIFNSKNRSTASGKQSLLPTSSSSSSSSALRSKSIKQQSNCNLVQSYQAIFPQPANPTVAKVCPSCKCNCRPLKRCEYCNQPLPKSNNVRQNASNNKNEPEFKTLSDLVNSKQLNSSSSSSSATTAAASRSSVVVSKKKGMGTFNSKSVAITLDDGSGEQSSSSISTITKGDNFKKCDTNRKEESISSKPPSTPNRSSLSGNHHHDTTGSPYNPISTTSFYGDKGKTNARFNRLTKATVLGPHQNVSSSSSTSRLSSLRQIEQLVDSNLASKTPVRPELSKYSAIHLEPLKMFFGNFGCSCSRLDFRDESLSFGADGKKWQLPYSVISQIKIQKHDFTYLYFRIKQVTYDAVRMHSKIQQHLSSQGPEFKMDPKDTNTMFRYIIFQCLNDSDVNKLSNYSNRFTIRLNFPESKNMKTLTTKIVNSNFERHDNEFKKDVAGSQSQKEEIYSCSPKKTYEKMTKSVYQRSYDSCSSSLYDESRQTIERKTRPADFGTSPTSHSLPKKVKTVVELDSESDEEGIQPVNGNAILTFESNGNCSDESITLYSSDLRCLEEREFLNDTIIGFYLLYIKKRLPKEISDRTYILNTFFYSTLKRRKRNDNNNLSLNENIYNRVKNWTKNIDIFSYDFIIVPMNECKHWFLAIICYPGREASVWDRKKKPCIVFMDSLHEEGTLTISRPFRSFLEMEWQTKKLTKKSFEENVFPVVNARVPKQTNGYDCGLYLLQYVEYFLSNPDRIMLQIERNHINLSNWFGPALIHNKRQSIRGKIMSLSRLDNQKNLTEDKKEIQRSECETKNEEEDSLIGIESDQQKQDTNQVQEEQAGDDSSNSSSKPLNNISKLHLDNTESTNNNRSNHFASQVCLTSDDEDELMECVPEDSLPGKENTTSFHKLLDKNKVVTSGHEKCKDDLALFLDSVTTDEDDDDSPVVIESRKDAKNSKKSQFPKRSSHYPDRSGYSDFYEPVSDIDSDSEIVF